MIIKLYYVKLTWSKEIESGPYSLNDALERKEALEKNSIENFEIVEQVVSMESVF